MRRHAVLLASSTGALLKASLISGIALTPTSASFAQQPAPQPRKVLTCISVSLNNNDKGRSVIRIQAVPNQTDATAGEMLIEVDPKCVTEMASTQSSTAPTQSSQLPSPDQYALARKAVDDAVEASGLTPAAKDTTKQRLNNTIDQAEKDGASPADDLRAANNANADSADKSGDKNTAMIAAVGAVAAACMVFTAGVCAGVAASILPSLLSPSISNQDIAGVARAVQSASEGRPIAPDDLKSLRKVIDTGTKGLKPQYRDAAQVLLDDPLGRLRHEIANSFKIPEARMEAGIAFLEGAIRRNHFECDDFQRALAIGRVRVGASTRDQIVDKVMNSVTVLRGSDDISGNVRECLQKILIAS